MVRELMKCNVSQRKVQGVDGGRVARWFDILVS